jgi:cytochrome c oxidase cbb3-type subunit 2
MELFSNHIKLFFAVTTLFVALTFVVAILPAINNQQNNAPLPGTEKLSGSALRGKGIYIANGCVACHTQQVRNVDMDNTWGERPGIAADYAHVERTSVWENPATLMGTERTGPDLTNIGTRQPSTDWHLMHLYNPRAVVEKSIMPAYSWMFEMKDEVEEGETVVNIPSQFLNGGQGKVIARQEALDLVAYLQSLKQAPLPENNPAPEFLYKKEEPKEEAMGTAEAPLDGQALYSKNCQSCHQANGEGLKGAFPPLKGSKIVLDDDPHIMVEVIMNGYNAREDFGVMPPVGTNNKLTPAEVAAIMNHEKSSWGNNARKVSVEEVKQIIDFIGAQTSTK